LHNLFEKATTYFYRPQKSSVNIFIRYLRIEHKKTNKYTINIIYNRKQELPWQRPWILHQTIR
jgi:hypothetical protein